MDMKNYITDIKTSFSRPSVRGIYIKNNKIAVIYSNKYDYYKLPGGGIDSSESHIEALIREVQEESGLLVKPDTIKEYGHVLVKEKGSKEDLFIQDNYYYFFEAKNELGKRNLDEYEAIEGYELRFVSPEEFINVNLTHNHFDYSDLTMLKREIKAMQLLVKEEYIK